MIRDNMKAKILFSTLLFTFFSISLFSWHDQTHISVGTAAGFRMAYNLAAPDVAKVKAKDVEGLNHYCNLPEQITVTPDFVSKQIEKYNTTQDTLGHLYGAIIGSMRNYQSETKKGKYSDYNLAYLGHYIGDLSMPLHNMEYSEFNKKNHTTNDAIIENEVATNIDKIKIQPLKIETENDLINYIVQIANESKELGYKLQSEKRNLTKEEAYSRISRSASLFKAVLEYVKFK